MDIRVFHGTLKIPAQTPLDRPERVFVEMEPGRVIQVTIFFPWGHAGLTGLQIWKGGSQIFPFPDGAWLIGNDQTYVYPLNVMLDEEPAGLTLVGYNEDEYFDHTIYVTFAVVSLRSLISVLDLFQIFGLGRM